MVIDLIGDEQQKKTRYRSHEQNFNEFIGNIKLRNIIVIECVKNYMKIMVKF